MKTYTVKLEESVEYVVEVQAHSAKEAEVEAKKHPEKWEESNGGLYTICVEQTKI